MAGTGSGVGMLLLTGGEGRRFGAPKHLQPHPEGGSWAGHLVRVFRELCPEGPIQVAGAPVPEAPGLTRVEDPREGPAVALRAWAAASPPPVGRWWVVACDQIRWTPAALRAWLERAEAADPRAEAWVLGNWGGRRQYLGGFLGGVRVADLAGLEARSLRALADGVPTLVLDVEDAAWADVDRPEDL